MTQIALLEHVSPEYAVHFQALPAGQDLLYKGIPAGPA